MTLVFALVGLVAVLTDDGKYFSSERDAALLLIFLVVIGVVLDSIGIRKRVVAIEDEKQRRIDEISAEYLMAKLQSPRPGEIKDRFVPFALRHLARECLSARQGGEDASRVARIHFTEVKRALVLHDQRFSWLDAVRTPEQVFELQP